MGYSPGFLDQKRSIFDTCEFTRNRHKRLRTKIEIILEGFLRRFREFGAISSTYQNPPCSKPWAIVQAFCSKTGSFRPWRIHPKSIQTIAQGVVNKFRRVFVAFHRVWSDFHDLQNSAMLKTMGYSPGLLLKNGQFAILGIKPKSTETVAEGVRNPLRRVFESFQKVWSDFQDFPKLAMFKTMGYSPGFLVKNGQFSTLANSWEIDANGRALS